MKSISIWTLIMTIFFFSCQKQEKPLLTSPKNQELSKSIPELKSRLQQIFNSNKADETVKEITDIKYFGGKHNMIAIVKYLDNKNKVKDIGIQQTYDEFGNRVSDITIQCVGSCNVGCSLEGKYDPNNHDNDYVQCTCSSCSMTVTSTNKNFEVNQKAAFSIEEMARKSYVETFQRYSPKVIIKKAVFSENDFLRTTTYEYADEYGKTSTFLVVVPKKNGISAGGTMLREDKSYVVDCTGSCDCRERFIPSSGAIECTCSPCSMKVTEVP